MAKLIMTMFTAALALLFTVPPVTTALQTAPSQVDLMAQSRGLRKAVRLENVRAHQAAFQSIADANGGTRASGTGGFDASAQYVYDQAAAAGLAVSRQEFTYSFVGDQSPPELAQLSPAAKTYVAGSDFATMVYSGSGDVTAQVWAVDLVVPSPAPNASTSGCQAEDFAGFPAGAIALMQRGTCTFRTKFENARAAGAAGVIIFNEGNPERTGLFPVTLGAPPASLPAVFATFALGTELSNGGLNGQTGVTVRLKTDVVYEVRSTSNIIAETPGGDPTSVIVVGAHLDSGTTGPGINDNGSGSAAILEVAKIFQAQERKPRNKLRFIWFGAEEVGLIGSTHYVNSLSEAERDQIRLLLNFDMVGSPNFVRFVYDGDNSSFTAGPGVTQYPPGSGEIERVFLDYFQALGLPIEPAHSGGRSDDGPFIAAGIPAGGLFTGAEGVKSAEQAAVFGGTAGVPYDPCYHLACDTFANASVTVLDEMSDAIAHAVLTFSRRDFARQPRAAPGTSGTAALDH